MTKLIVAFLRFVNAPKSTRCFKYDRDKCGLFTHKSVPVIFEPLCISYQVNARLFALNSYKIALSSLPYNSLSNKKPIIRDCIIGAIETAVKQQQNKYVIYITGLPL
jgi:hypothetical protein